MSKTLIIAEKPSVAGDLARVLGKKTGKFRKDDNSGRLFPDDFDRIVKSDLYDRGRLARRTLFKRRVDNMVY